MNVIRHAGIIAFAVATVAAWPGSASAGSCPGAPRTITGTVYCDNKFVLWVNGDKVVEDPIDFTPHQAVSVTFDWDGKSSLTYAIRCEDYASSSGYEYVGTGWPQLGDGALIAAFDDGFGTVTSADGWRVHTVTFGPTDASVTAGCSPRNLDACEVEDRGEPANWTAVDYDDSHWRKATAFSAAAAGWGRAPQWSSTKGCCTLTSSFDRSNLGCATQVDELQCLVPRAVFADSAAGFIWAADLERDNRVLFRHSVDCE